MALADDPTLNGAPANPDEAFGMEDVADLIDKLGNAIKLNAYRSAMATTPDDAKGYGQAALFNAQALNALIPYQDPTAANPRGDNPAKRGD